MSAVTPLSASQQTLHIPLSLPPTLLGSAKYAVVLRPTDGQSFCLNFKYISQTDGALLLLQRIMKKRNGQYRKPVQGVLCEAVVQGSTCSKGQDCQHIHCTPAGLKAMRPWNAAPPAKVPKTPTEEAKESRHDSTDEGGIPSSEDFSDVSSDRAVRKHGQLQATTLAPTGLAPSPFAFVALAHRPLALLPYPRAVKQSSARLRQWMQHRDGPPPATSRQPLPLQPTVHEPYAFGGRR